MPSFIIRLRTIVVINLTLFLFNLSILAAPVLSQDSNINLASERTTVLTTLHLPSTKEIEFVQVDMIQELDKPIDWFIKTAHEITHGNANDLISVIQNGEKLINDFTTKLPQSIAIAGTNDGVGKVLGDIIEDFKKISDKINEFEEVGKIIIEKHIIVANETKAHIAQIDHLINILENDVKILEYNIDISNRNNNLEAQVFWKEFKKDWLKSHIDTKNKIRDIKNDLVTLKLKIVELIQIINPFIDGITVETPKEVRSSYNNLVATIRSEQVCRCFTNLSSKKISFESIKRALTQQIDSIRTKVPELYHEVIEIEKLYAPRFLRRRDEPSVWIKVVDSMESYQNRWNEMAIKLEDWNKEFWIARQCH